MVFAKIMKSLYFFFLGKIRKKKCLVTFQIENQHLQTIKTWIEKTVEKLAIFQRGQSIVSAKIMKFLYFFFLGKIRKKTCLVTFQIENQHLQTIKTWIKKNCKIGIFKKRGQSMVLAKINKFLYLFISGKTGQEKEFCNLLDRKLAFLDYKNNDLKKSKNWHFSKGVSPWFSPKL